LGPLLLGPAGHPYPPSLGSAAKPSLINLGLGRRTQQLGIHLGLTLLGSKAQHHWVMLGRMTQQLGTHLDPTLLGHAWQKNPATLGLAGQQDLASLNHVW